MGLAEEIAELGVAAAALSRLLADRDLAIRLAEAGRRHVEANFGVKAMLDAMEEALIKMTITC